VGFGAKLGIYRMPSDAATLRIFSEITYSEGNWWKALIFCVDPLMCTNLPWFSLVHGARSVLLRPTKCQGDNDTESSLGGAVAVIPEKGERKARESKLVVTHE
jgi:hypothetical protein